MLKYHKRSFISLLDFVFLPGEILVSTMINFYSQTGAHMGSSDNCIGNFEKWF